MVKYFVTNVLVCIIIWCYLVDIDGSPRRGRSRIGYNRLHSRMPIMIQHRPLNGDNYYEHKDVHEWPVGNDTMKSKMEIDPTTQQDAGYYECQANNQYSIDIRGFRTDYVMITY
ncbi:hypothetical protein FQR65_LT03789 [Abscondita terminalis]|nr:hypothetical protein FQR65_LT03789 [Abscondita terminalis]